MKKPSRLYRTFDRFGPRWGMFEVTAGDRTFTDDDITEITITRGNSSPHPSFTPSTMEIGFVGAISIPRDTDLTCNLVPQLASGLSADTPHHGATVLRRFRGRKALSTTDDRTWRSGEPGRWNTTITASSWSALIKRASRGMSPFGKSGSAVVTALRHPDLEQFYSVSYSSLTDFDSMAERDPNLTTAEMIEKYGDKLHTLIQHKRDGDIRVISNVARRDEVMSPGPVWTLLRSHTLSPAKWSAPSESATTKYGVRYTTEGGVPYTQPWPLPLAGIVALREETIDLEHIVSGPDFRSRDILANAVNNYENWSRLGVESVTIDLGLLWRRRDPSSVRTIVEALRLEEGTPVHLGADWPVAVRGPYFANQITEKITPDEWTITLDLFHARYVVGLGDDDLPTPQPITWDASNRTWHATAGPWN